MLYALNSVHCLLSDIICTCAHSIRLELSCWPFFTSYLIPIILKLIILPSAHHLYHLPSCVFNPKIILSLTISKFTPFRVFTTNCSVCNLKWENGTFTSNQFNLCGFNRSFSASSIFDQKLPKRSISTAHHWKLFAGFKKLKMLLAQRHSQIFLRLTFEVHIVPLQNGVKNMVQSTLFGFQNRWSCLPPWKQ